jgi:hypothetical protein
MKQATQKTAQKEREDRSCIFCKHSIADFAMLVHPNGIMPLPVTSCGSYDVQKTMFEFALDPKKVKGYLDHRDLFFFPCDYSNILCKGKFFEAKQGGP